MKAFLVYCLSSGEVFHFDTARDVCSFMLGLDKRLYRIFVRVSNPSSNVCELAQQLNRYDDKPKPVSL